MERGNERKGEGGREREDEKDKNMSVLLVRETPLLPGQPGRNLAFPILWI
jgi:hypothetical protein